MRIFISHDREQASGHAGRLYDSLVSRFGEESVVLSDGRVGSEAAGTADVLIAVVGTGWARAAEGRIGEEVATALEGRIKVIPTLVQEATMPGSDELPERLTTLARRQPLELRDDRWREDVQTLAETLERVGGIEPAPSAAAPVQPAGPAVAAEEVEARRPETWVPSLAAGVAGGALLFLGVFLRLEGDSRPIDDRWVAVEYLGTALGVLAVAGLLVARQIGLPFAAGAWAGIGLASLADSLTVFLLTEGGRASGQVVLTAGGVAVLAAGVLPWFDHLRRLAGERFAVTPPQLLALIGGLLVALATFLAWAEVEFLEETVSIFDTPNNHRGAIEPLVPAAAIVLVALLAMALGRAFAAGALVGLAFTVLLLFLHLLGFSLDEAGLKIREGGPLGVLGTLAVIAAGIAIYAPLRRADSLSGRDTPS